MMPQLAAGSQMNVQIFFQPIKWTILKVYSYTERIKLVWLGLNSVITSPSRTLHTQEEDLKASVGFLWHNAELKKTGCLYFRLYWSPSYKAQPEALYQRWDVGGGAAALLKVVGKLSARIHDPADCRHFFPPVFQASPVKGPDYQISALLCTLLLSEKHHTVVSFPLSLFTPVIL